MFDSSDVAVVRPFIDEVINAGWIGLVDDLSSNDLSLYRGSLGEIRGLAAYKAFRASAGGAFNGMHLTVRDVVTAEGKVAVRFRNSGTHSARSATKREITPEERRRVRGAARRSGGLSSLCPPS